MKDDPTIAAIREARHHISESVGHDPRKLVDYFRRLQNRHQERIISQKPKYPEKESDSQLAHKRDSFSPTPQV